MTDKLEQQLLNIRGEYIKYDTKTYGVINFKKMTGSIVIYTDKRTFNFLNSEIDDFLENIEVIETKQPFKANIAASAFNIDSSTEKLPTIKENKSLALYQQTDAQKQIQSSLLDMLKKVQENPKIIPQAKAVCEIANAMVNMEKTQIQLLRLSKRKMNRL